MKIAVASADGTTLSPHFGRSTCFIVFDTEEGKVIGRETRNNTHTAFAKGECSGEHHEHGQEHSHAAVVNALSDCRAVLCGGMGWRAAEELKASGIQTLVVEGEATPEETVAAYLAGKLKSNGRFCRCQH
jgi:predicted Fe-Mo cluster-binding NifX family protein